MAISNGRRLGRSLRLRRIRLAIEKAPKPAIHITRSRVPKKRPGVFSKLRGRRHAAGRNLSLHARAREQMNRRRSQLRAKQWHGGKQYAGHRMHGTGGGWKFAHKGGHRGMTPKQRAHLAYLHQHYHRKAK